MKFWPERLNYAEKNDRFLFIFVLFKQQKLLTAAEFKLKSSK